MLSITLPSSHSLPLFLSLCELWYSSISLRRRRQQHQRTFRRTRPKRSITRYDRRRGPNARSNGTLLESINTCSQIIINTNRVNIKKLKQKARTHEHKSSSSITGNRNACTASLTDSISCRPGIDDRGEGGGGCEGGDVGELHGGLWTWE